MRRHATALALLLLVPLAGCDLLGIESASAVAARREAEGKAIGGACRHAGRAIEDCYVLNRKADKGAIFAGWREMNDYMIENKLEVVAPTLPPPGAPAPVTAAVDDEGDTARPAKPRSH
ncbi:MAG TPA: hypothetical protein PKJ45_11020 [Rubrivivax sp.]|nr:hypothetical protein [Burkholderiales bacterium]HNU11874.1 hypothetical protein [Rubrivivax sp.]